VLTERAGEGVAELLVVVFETADPFGGGCRRCSKDASVAR